ncbi:MAG TPA: hypothetical protein VKO16_07525, partial [Polyangia bacterium]|nr:hypothetical protein [Polyangia bacterium]
MNTREPRARLVPVACRYAKRSKPLQLAANQLKIHPRSPSEPRFSHDAEPEQVKAVVYVGDVRFLGRERQSHLLCHELGRLLFDGLG